VSNWPPDNTRNSRPNPPQGLPPYGPPAPGYAASGPQPVPQSQGGAARRWWKSIPDAAKAFVVFAALLVMCGAGAAVVGAVNSANSPDSGSAKTAADHPLATGLSPATSAAPTGSQSTATPSASPTPSVDKQTVTETQPVPFTSKQVNDSSLAQGTTKVRTKGVNGTKTVTFEVTFTNGVQTSKTMVSEKVTKQPVTEVIAVGTKQTKKCDPNYSGCVPIASDVDCAGGSGNGPAYVQGPVTVIGTDIYGLDNDGDGIGCES
jgi:hypothetical protein